MKKAKYIQLLLVIIVASTTSFFLAKFSYDKLDTRLQSKLFFKEDPFILGTYEEQYFKFDENVFDLVEEIRFAKDPICKLNKIGSVLPITVLKDGDFFIVEIINTNKKNNVDCFEHILSSIKLNFDKKIKKKINQLNFQQSLKMEVLKELENQYLNLEFVKRDAKKINFSEFLKLLNNDKVLKIGITEDIILGEMKNGDNFFTTSLDVRESDYLIKTMYDSGINFYFIVDPLSKNKIYKEFLFEENIEFGLSLRYFQNKLDQYPYMSVNITHDEIKLRFKIYLLIILIVLNFFGIIVFVYLNRIYFKSVFKFLKKIA